ncbi:hypothetical protein [Natronomonas amylolytica]|uniref:hypothetical protein n=1 Tax=Natronomonas amylolytica TaxID=3108498 RepID=UPI00300A6716
MVGDLVNSDEIGQIYATLAEDVAGREERLQEELPIETTAEIHTHLRSVVNDWETGRKSLRTVPVCSAYAHELDRPLGDSLKRLLTGLDASINVLDDIIDTQDLSPRARIGLTVNAGFSAVLLAEHSPPDARNEIRDRLRDYFTALFQIPLVEQRLFASMADTEDEHRRHEAATQIYAYRSRDIDAFADIAAIVTDPNVEAEQRLRRDLRTYRARRLLLKDIRDVERDLRDDDMTPVIYLLQHHETTGDVLDAVTDLYRRFSYSEDGNKRYGETLRELEKVPDDLHSVLSGAKDHVDAAETL